MKGIVFTGQRNIELRDFPDPTPGPGEVVLEIKASGMCGSDLHYYRSEEGAAAMAKALGIRGAGPEVIAGHEPCGVVVARGAGVEERFAPIGARVMVHHYDGCGICPSCRQGWAQLCEDAFTIYGVTGDGAHAPYMKVPANTLVTLPTGLGKTAAALWAALRVAFATDRRGFFATARTTQQRMAEESLARLASLGVPLRAVSIENLRPKPLPRAALAAARPTPRGSLRGASLAPPRARGLGDAG